MNGENLDKDKLQEKAKQIYIHDKSFIDKAVEQCTPKYLQDIVTWHLGRVVSVKAEYYILPNGLHVYKEFDGSQHVRTHISTEELSNPYNALERKSNLVVSIDANEGDNAKRFGKNIYLKVNDTAIVFLLPDDKEMTLYGGWYRDEESGYTKTANLRVSEDTKSIFDCIYLDDIPLYSDLPEDEKKTLKHKITELFSKLYSRDFKQKETTGENQTYSKTKDEFSEPEIVILKSENEVYETERRIAELSFENNELKKSIVELKKIILELGKDSEIGRQMIEAFDRVLNADIGPKKR